MKISKLFHTLYASLMTLPLLVIPIFALNILHKETEPISITTAGYELMPKFETNEVQDYNTDLVEGNIYKFTYNSFVNSNGSYLLEATNIYNMGFFTDIEADAYTDNFMIIELRTNGFIIRDSQYNNVMGNLNVSLPYSFEFVYYGKESNWADYSVNVSITSTTFNKVDYVWNEGIVYDNTDIGSQFIYALYKPVHDYFNISDFFGLGALEDWFIMNLYSGGNTLVFSMIFDLAIYWLAISLFWLIFDVLMYVPSMIHKMLDKARME